MSFKNASIGLLTTFQDRRIHPIIAFPMAPSELASCPDCQFNRMSRSGPASRTFNWLSQLVTILAAISFGVFSVLSWQLGKASTTEGRTANQMNIVTICLSNKVYSTYRYMIRNSGTQSYIGPSRYPTLSNGAWDIGRAHARVVECVLR